MKKIQISLLVLAVALGGSLAVSAQNDWLGAQLLTPKLKNQILGLDVVKTAPDSPDFLNSFNFYKNGKSEKELIKEYSDQIVADASFVAKYGKEIVSYVDRISKNPQLKPMLPIWPEYNVATVEAVLSYLFANEREPVKFAIENKIVPANVKNGSFLSRREFLEILGKIFMDTDKDPSVVLNELGFIDTQTDWNSTSKEGFKLVEAIRLVLNLRELIERKNITQSKAAYAEKLAFLPSGAAELSEESIKVMVTAFTAEASIEVDAEAMQKYLVAKYKNQFGKTLTSEHINAIRNEFYYESGLVPPPVYQLPIDQRVGDCENEVFRKTYMGPVAVTGPLGASIICDRFMINFPADSYILNVYSLPKIAVKNDAQFGKVVRTDVMRSYQNSLVVNAKGEQKIIIVYAPKDLKRKVGTEVKVAIGDHEGNKLAEIEKVISPLGLSLQLHLRSTTGDNLVLQK